VVAEEFIDKLDVEERKRAKIARAFRDTEKCRRIGSK